MDGCPQPEELATPDPGVAQHLEACSECRSKKEILDLLAAPESPEETRALDALRRSPSSALAAAQLRAGRGSLRFRSAVWPRALMAAAGVAAAAAVAFAVLRPEDPAHVLFDLQGSARPLEVALADAPWAPYSPVRGGESEARFDKPLRQLLEAREKGRPGADRALAMLFLLRGGAGDAARTDEALARAGDGADALNDRGVVAWARGDTTHALDLFDRALSAAPSHPAAGFNRALALERLGLGPPALSAYEAASRGGGKWAAEALERGARLRAKTARAPQAPVRREALLAMLSASTPAELAEASRKVQALPAGIAADLIALERKLSRLGDAALDEHGRLFKVYTSLRARAVTGAVEPQEVEEFARLQRVSLDPLLWAPALQLAGFVHQARGEWRSAERFMRSLAAACRVRGCAVENEAIALDEAADAAGRDGDFATAQRLQTRAEALFASVAAELQLGELHAKRAAVLDEERRYDEAARSATLALGTLAELGDGRDVHAAQAMALAVAAEVAGHRGDHHAAADLGGAAIEVAHAAGARDVEVSAEAALAVELAAIGQGADARVRLEQKLRALEDAHHASDTAPLHAALASTLLRQGDAQGALAAVERGRAAAREGAWEVSTVAQLALPQARALHSLGRDDEARRALDAALDAAVQSAKGAKDPVALLAPLGDLATELARLLAAAHRPAEEVLLPLDKLRAALVGVQPAAPGWSQALPLGTCVRGPAGVSVGACAPGDDVWWFSDEEPPASVAGVATSLSRLVAPGPARASSALLVSGAVTQGDLAGAAVALPNAALEKDALEHAGLAVEELSGSAATPEAALAAAAGKPVLHFAVHGFDRPEGGFLQLSGDPGRLSAQDLARVRLDGPLVVLAACETAVPGPRGLAWAFARSGASAVVAARGKLDDAAAAAFSAKLHAALARGTPVLRAAREAEADPDHPRFMVLK